MDILLPFLDIIGPDGQRFQVELEKDAVTIGRFEPFNDIALFPDPQQLITRNGREVMRSSINITSLAALTRQGIPTWNEADFQGLIHQL